MACDEGALLICTPGDLVGGVVDGVVGDVATSAWGSVCKSFADAAVTMLKGFATAFAAFPNVDLSSDGVRSVYGISLGIAGFVAALLLLVQIARTVITHDGNALAQGFVGVGKAGLAFLLTLTVASASLVAADGLTGFIINQTFGNAQGLTTKLTTLFELDTIDSPSLMLLLAVIGILLVAVLWFELLLRNAAIAVLIGTSPISAAGQASEATKQWWSQLVSATVRLIILKPVIALVFAVGFGLFGSETKDLATLLAGMLVLLLAALAWPAIARFFTFAAAHSGGPSGLAAVLGFAAGRMSGSSGGGVPGGVEPDQFGQQAETRTMSSFAARGGGSAASGAASNAGAGAGGSAAAGGGAAAGGAAAGAGAAVAPVLLAVKGAQLAQRAANSLVGRFEQTAGHAGLPGANPHAYPAGYPRPIPTMTGGGSTSAPRSSGGHSELAAPPPPEPSTADVPAQPSTAPPPDPSPGSGPGPAGDARPEAAPAGPGAELRPSATAEPPPASAQAPTADTPAAPDAPPPSPATSAPPPVIPQQRPASPVEHMRPQQSSPVEFEKGDPS